MDLVRCKWIRNSLKSPWFPLSVQLLIFIVFVLLIIGAWGASTDDPAFAKILRNTNLSNLIVWSFWWPGMILTVILLGRIWCMICPLELITSAGSHIGLKRTVPRWLRKGWIITILYGVILVIGVHGFNIHRVPHRMALYLLLLGILAIAFGLIFERRALCSFVCPVGYVLGLYAHCAPLEWRIKDASVCRKCTEKPCMSKATRYRWYGRACPNGLAPPQLNHNGDCILCTQCFKACPYDNFRWSTRRWFADVFTRIQLPLPQVAFLVVVSGFVIYEIAAEWSDGKRILLTLPNAIAGWLHLTNPPWDGIVHGVILFGVFPVLIWLLPAVLDYFMSGKHHSVTHYFMRYGVYYIPIVASTHAIKALQKIFSRLSYIPGAITHPRGMAWAHAIYTGALRPPVNVAGRLDWLLTPLMFALLCVGIIVAFTALRYSLQCESDDEHHRPIAPVIGLSLYALIIVIILIGWRLFG
ncbi:MAG TPA: hypothetical protein EYP10_06660 [Armatimonadetes bacterium]|nr:hypothetical protein [Armatimonadota bacterium]